MGVVYAHTRLRPYQLHGDTLRLFGLAEELEHRDVAARAALPRGLEDELDGRARVEVEDLVRALRVRVGEERRGDGRRDARDFTRAISACDMP